MSPAPIVTLIVDSGEARSSGGMDAESWNAALAALRAVLERGGRAMLAASTGFRLPLLLAAAEYIFASRLEAPEGPSPPPVVLAPFPSDDIFEDHLLYEKQRGQEEEARSSLLERLASVGLAEEPPEIDLLRAEPYEAFHRVLFGYRPKAVCAVGNSKRLGSFASVAENYQREIREVRLVWLFGSRGESPREWEDVSPWLSSLHEIPTHFEDALGRAFREDDELVTNLVRRVGEQTARALAIDHAVSQLLGED